MTIGFNLLELDKASVLRCLESGASAFTAIDAKGAGDLDLYLVPEGYIMWKAQFRNIERMNANSLEAANPKFLLALGPCLVFVVIPTEIPDSFLSSVWTKPVHERKDHSARDLAKQPLDSH